MTPIETVDTVVIGAGHAGLAVSRLLTDAGHDHVVLDRGRVGERWRSERWDSLHLLTPNWLTRLPGWWYVGPQQDGYMSAARFVRHLERYAASFSAPVVGGTTVHALSARRGGYRLDTDRGIWHARQVVVATGPHGAPHMPAGVAGAGPETEVVSSTGYRNPGQLAPGGVLVVGASASGVQIADELVRAGRDVTLAVGRHTRMPRRYRGMDVFWWLEKTGRLARTIDTMSDPQAARAEPSLQLAGRNEPDRHDADLDLAALQRQGVRLTGRLQEVAGGTASFADGLGDTVARADHAMHRFLDAVDHYVEQAGLTREVWPATRPAAVQSQDAPRRLDLRAEGISTVVTATGHRPAHPWLRVDVTGADGHIRQSRGVTPAPGLYVVGQRFQHRRDSSFIDGARHDARLVVGHLLRRAGHADDTAEESVA